MYEPTDNGKTKFTAKAGDYVSGLFVCPSHSCERVLSGTVWGIFLNIYHKSSPELKKEVNLVVNCLKRSRSLWPHNTRFCP